MKYIITLFLVFLSSCVYSQVGVGTTTPDESSALDITSVNSGFLLPRMTTANRDAIVNPAKGLIIYNLDTNSLNFNVGTKVAPNWGGVFAEANQSGSYEIGGTASGWNYYDVTFTNPFTNIPSIQLTFREGTGIDNSGSNSVTHIKVANASTTGFTIAVYDTSLTYDVFIDWFAAPKTQ